MEVVMVCILIKQGLKAKCFNFIQIKIGLMVLLTTPFLWTKLQSSL